MTNFRVTFETVLSQTVDVEAEDVDTALDAAYDNLEGVPFIGWNFDAAGEWNPVYAYNEDTGEDIEVESWF